MLMVLFLSPLLGKGKKNTKSEQKSGTVGKGAGKKITKIIGLGKKKPSTDEQTSSAEEDVPTCGNCDFLHGFSSFYRAFWHPVLTFIIVIKASVQPHCIISSTEASDLPIALFFFFIFS